MKSIFDFDVTGLAVSENALILAYLIYLIQRRIPMDFSSVREAHELLGRLERLSYKRHHVAPGSSYDFEAIFGDGVGLDAEALLWKVLDEIDSTGDALKPKTEEQYELAFHRISRLCEIAEPLWDRAHEAWLRWKVIADALRLMQMIEQG